MGPIRQGGTDDLRRESGRVLIVRPILFFFLQLKLLRALSVSNWLQLTE